MVFLGIYPDTSSAGYIFGWIASVVLFVFAVVWMLTIGARSNDKYLFGAPSIPNGKWASIAVLVWRLFGLGLSFTCIYYVFSAPYTEPQAFPYEFEPIYFTITPPAQGSFLPFGIQTNLLPPPVKTAQIVSDKVWNISYFTNWNFMSIAFYFVVSTIVSLVRIFAPSSVPVISKVNNFKEYRRVSGPSRAERSGLITALLHTQQHAAEMLLPTAIFVTFYVWTYLYPTAPSQMAPEFAGIANIIEEIDVEFQPASMVNTTIPLINLTFEQIYMLIAPELGALKMLDYDGYNIYTPEFTSITVHGMNSVLLLIDFFVSGYRFNPTHFALPLAWGTAYMIMTLALSTAYGMVCYPGMETDNIQFLFWLPVVFIIVILNFVLFTLLSKLKHRDFSPKYIASFFQIDSDNNDVDEAFSSDSNQIKLEQSKEGPVEVA